ncbi:MAG: InlB B-repeat-containing protein [Thermoplasmata archaeon]
MFEVGARPVRRGSERIGFVWGIAILVAVLMCLPAGGFGLTGGSSAPGSGSAAAPVSSSASPGASVTNSPAVMNVSGLFYGTNDSFATLPGSDSPCGLGYTNYTYWNFGFVDFYQYEQCVGGAQNPSIFTLPDGQLGIAYSVYTNQPTSCANSTGLVVSRIGFQTSSDGGETFAPAQYLGNETCSWLQAGEPSFAVSSNGNVDGTFVQANFTPYAPDLTVNTTNYQETPLNSQFWVNYGNRTNVTGVNLTANMTDTTDSLAFVSSSDNGTSFSEPVTLSVAGLGQIARPQLATFGNTIYIAYDQLDNWTNLSLPNLYGYADAQPISVELIYSTDNGATWNGPYGLPGLNASSGYTAMTPAISVSSTGVLGIGYATDRGCFYTYFGSCEYWGDQITVATSTTNGTSWGTLAALGTVGESHCQGYSNDTGPSYYYYCYAYQFQAAPEISLYWSDSASATLYAAWSGIYLYNNTIGTLSFGEGGLFSGVSADGGATWTNATVAAPTYYPSCTTCIEIPVYFYNPALVSHDGTVYLVYSQLNETYCYGPSCPPWANAYSYWLTNSTDGLTWNEPIALSIATTSYYASYLAWAGYNDAITYGPNGPTAAYAQLGPYREVLTDHQGSYANGTSYYYGNYTYTAQSNLTVAAPWAGPTVPVTINETGLPAGTQWQFSIGPLAVTTNASSVVVTNFPLGQIQYFVLGSTNFSAYRTEFSTVSTPDGPYLFTHAGNITVVFTAFYGIELFANPPDPMLFDFYFYNQTTVTEYYYELYNYTYGHFTNIGPTAFPWYFPAGSVIPLTVTAAPAVSYWAGTGNGSFSGAVGTSPPVIVVNGPINETAWMGAFSTYNVTFTPVGLPSGTNYSFDFSGTPYSATAPAGVVVPSVSTGAYAVSSIVAQSAVSGYVYFGQVNGGNTVLIPVTPNVELNFTFAYVNTSAPMTQASFYGGALAPGDVWTLSFNGTEYSSSTPWINVTARPGTYAVSAYPIVNSANNTAGYTPIAFGPTVTVGAAGSSFNVTYAPAFRVEIAATGGGTVTGSGTHYVTPGSSVSYTATPIADYAFLGWTGTGFGSYTGPNATAQVTVNGPITESAQFVLLPATRFSLTVNATGLPAGSWWTIELNGAGYSSNASSFVIPNLYSCSAGSPGRYTVVVPYVYQNGTSGVRFVPASYPASTCTTGATTVTISYSTQYLVTPLGTTGGAGKVVVGGVPSMAPAWVTASQGIGIQAITSNGYLFVEWTGSGPGSYSGPSVSTEIFPTGPVSETASFAPIVIPPPVLYTVTFTQSSLPAGTPWSIAVNGHSYGTTSSTLNVTGLSGSTTYPLVVSTASSTDRSAQFPPIAPPTSVAIAGHNVSVALSFATVYQFSVRSTYGGSVSGVPASGYVLSGGAVQLTAIPGIGYEFLGWTGTGSGAYSGTNATPTVTVGGPISEVATFAATPPSSSSSPPFLASTTGLAVLAVVGLIAGLGIGILLMRRRGGAAGGGR